VTRYLNIAVILALIGSAVYAYTIKYQTAFRAEQIAKTKLEIKAERDLAAMLRADWAYLTRPERVQELADRYLELEPLAPDRLMLAKQLPERAPHSDAIGDKIEMLGLGVASTPPADPASAPTTPKANAKAAGH